MEEKKCWNCGKELEGEDYHLDIGDNAICPECYENLTVCENCKKWTANGRFCDTCFSHCLDCEGCGETTHENNLTSDDNGTLLCPNCIEYYYICSSCGQWVKKDELCEYCEENEDENENELSDDWEEPEDWKPIEFEERPEKLPIIPTPKLFPYDIVKIIEAPEGKNIKGQVGLSPNNNYICVNYNIQHINGTLRSSMGHFTLNNLEIVVWKKPLWWYKSREEEKEGECFYCGTIEGIIKGGESNLLNHCPECKEKIKFDNYPRHLLKYNLDFNKNPNKDYVYVDNLPKKDNPSEVVTFNKKVCLNLWGLDNNYPLSRKAGDFYCLTSLHLDNPDDKGIELELNFLTNELASVFQKYLTMVIGGEIRHATAIQSIPKKILTQEVLTIIQESTISQSRRDRIDQWAKWKELCDTIGHIKILEAARAMFMNMNWSGSYGGYKWAKITEVLLMYLRREISKTTFVDTTFGLYHNNSMVLDKIFDTLDLTKILNYNLNNNMEGVLQWSSKEVQELWKSKKRIAQSKMTATTTTTTSTLKVEEWEEMNLGQLINAMKKG